MKLPKVGHTVYDQDGAKITIVSSQRFQTHIVAKCWHGKKAKTMTLHADGTLIASNDIALNDLLMPFFKKSWNANRRKAKLKQRRIRFMMDTVRENPVHIITAKAPEPGEYKERTLLDQLSGSCSAMANAQVFVNARIIEDPHNPENNGRPVIMKMQKSRLDGLYQLAKDIKEIK